MGSFSKYRRLFRNKAHMYWSGARRSYMVESPLMVICVDGSIPHGGPIELFIVPVRFPQGRGMCHHV